MSTTQWNENMHAFFDKFVNSKTTLNLLTYDNTLREKYDKENLADSDSFRSSELIKIRQIVVPSVLLRFVFSRYNKFSNSRTVAKAMTQCSLLMHRML